MNTNTSQSPPDQTHSEEEQSLIGQDPDQWEESLRDEARQCLCVRNSKEGICGGPEQQDDPCCHQDGKVGKGGGL